MKNQHTVHMCMFLFQSLMATSKLGGMTLSPLDREQMLVAIIIFFFFTRLYVCTMDYVLYTKQSISTRTQIIFLVNTFLTFNRIFSKTLGLEAEKCFVKQGG